MVYMIFVFILTFSYNTYTLLIYNKSRKEKVIEFLKLLGPLIFIVELQVIFILLDKLQVFGTYSYIAYITLILTLALIGLSFGYAITLYLLKPSMQIHAGNTLKLAISLSLISYMVPKVLALLMELKSIMNL